MKKFLLPVCAVLFLLCNRTLAQQDPLDEKILGEVVISANKFAEQKKNVAQKIDVITYNYIARVNAQNTGDLLVSTGNVFVQKSQQGGSSPVLRGFEASRVLLVIDGIRMNNAIYRAGHLQNVITVDQNMLERVEVLYGPASTLYGSDALGGVIHLRTKSPRFSSTQKIITSGTAFSRYSSANDEKTFHFNLNIGSRKFSWLQAYTYSYFGDMKMGRYYPGKYPDFGRRSQYVTNINGIDSVVDNPDDRVQRFSGYKQWDISQKFLHKINDNITHSLNFQLSNSSDVPRYDRLQDIRNGTLRYAQWYYGPQKRILGAYEMNISKFGFFNQFRINLNYQDIEESRHTREFRRYDRLDSRTEKLNIAGFIIDGQKIMGNNELTIGADGQLNDVHSSAKRTNLANGTVSKLDSRYPDGKNNMNYFGLYAQHLLKMKGGKLVMNDGIRFQLADLNSTIADNSFFNFPFTKITQTNFAATGNLGLVYLPSDDFRISANLSSGFRAPNIDDVSRIFESSTSQQRLVVPNPDIRPEYTYNIDLNISETINQKISFEITGFYTMFKNAIVLAPFTLNGQDSVLYNGIMSALFANQNRNMAFSYGFYISAEVTLAKNLVFENRVSYTYGRYKKADGTKVPMDHIPPVYGKSSLAYKTKKITAEIFLMFNDWKRIKDYNLDGEDNLQYATPEGMPGWITVNWRGSYATGKRLTFQVALENIFDRNYRYFASGFSAPGRNLVISARISI